MTLRGRLTLFMALVVLVLFGTSLVLNIVDTRNYQQHQLESHAQDTANALAITISAVPETDLASIELLISANFDSGYYRLISYYNSEGEALIHRERNDRLEGVPDWFIRLVEWGTPEKSAEVSRAWQPTGLVHVAGHPGYAYRNLWLELQQTFGLYCLVAAIAWVLLAMMLKMLLKPLQQLEVQANSICERNFTVQKVLPKTRDLRRVVEAMNRMSRTLRVLFSEQVVLSQHLRAKAYTDPVTTLLNRRAFSEQAAAILADDDGSAGGTLIVLQIRDFHRYNFEHGRVDGDSLLVQVGERLAKTMIHNNNCLLARMGGAEFACFIPSIARQEAEQVAKDLFRQTLSLPYFATDAGADKLHLAGIFTTCHTDLSDLRIEADRLLRTLQKEGVNNWHMVCAEQHVSDHYLCWPSERWHAKLRLMLERRALKLFAQDVVDPGQRVLHREVLVHLQMGEELIPTGVFMPIAERYDLSERFDQVAVEDLINWLRLNRDGRLYCINLSPRSVQSPTFRVWLLDLLYRNHDLAHRLMIDIPEYALRLVGNELVQFCQMLKELSVKLAIDNFGLSGRTLPLLQQLRLDYLKVNRSYVSGLVENQNNQFFIRTLVQIASSWELQLLADGVECEGVWQLVLDLGLAGGRGKYLSQPESLNIES